MQFNFRAMRILTSIFLTFFVGLQVNNEVNAGEFQTAYQWKFLSYSDLPQGANYNYTHPVPFGIARHKNRMFICTARRNYGIPVTLGYFHLYEPSQQPAITPYPNYQMNTLHVSSLGRSQRHLKIDVMFTCVDVLIMITSLSVKRKQRP